MVQIAFGGDPVTLSGNPIEEGQTAPDFTVVNNDLEEVTLKDYDGKKKLISVVPSIDTGVCDKQTRKFNEEASSEEGGIVLTISEDLPFAQKRWCAASGLDNVVLLSDYQKHSFGKNFGVLMEGLELLARSVFVLDKDNKVVYSEIVSEGTDFPDFDSALKAYKELD
ncbi:thiol peroxidase [Staphylococcus debuckii]|uniref:thiol peroxidase n=1 Tax=Staphylococcus debuckii TaxID=2044912 RepID=UPI000F42FE73|nr:thiol peroxidase [Staphylococcus debuckii]AYU55475.1 thiol peroxidase [Staphylococcus debuckii]